MQLGAVTTFMQSKKGHHKPHSSGLRYLQLRWCIIQSEVTQCMSLLMQPDVTTDTIINVILHFLTRKTLRQRRFRYLTLVESTINSREGWRLRK